MVILEYSSDSFGPLRIKYSIWVGKVTVFLKIWKRNKVDGKAKQQGTRSVKCPFFLFYLVRMYSNSGVFK